MTDFNTAQRIVADTYGDGDYDHLTMLDECRDVGDTLFTFLMIELADSEGCDSLAEAARRVEMARKQLDEVTRHIAASEARTARHEAFRAAMDKAAAVPWDEAVIPRAARMLVARLVVAAEDAPGVRAFNKAVVEVAAEIETLPFEHQLAVWMLAAGGCNTPNEIIIVDSKPYLAFCKSIDARRDLFNQTLVVIGNEIRKHRAEF